MSIINDIKNRNFGDAVERVTKATGIKQAVDYISEKTGTSCGCDARKEAWNLGTNKNKIEMLKYYYMDNCPHCEAVNVPSTIEIEQINIHDKDYTGFRPQQVPILQYNTITLVGAPNINDFLSLLAKYAG